MKHLGIIVTICITLGGGLVAYGQLNNQVSTNKEIVGEVKQEVKQHNGQIQELEKFSVKQTVLMERQAKILEKLEEKLK